MPPSPAMTTSKRAIRGSISHGVATSLRRQRLCGPDLRDGLVSSRAARRRRVGDLGRSEEHTSELQSLAYLVCRLLLEKKKPTIASRSPLLSLFLAAAREPQLVEYLDV